MSFLGDFFRTVLGGALTVLSFAAFAALGPLQAPFWRTVFSWGSALVFGSTALLTAFSSRRPRLDAPEILYSTYGTNEPARTVYGTAVVGGLIISIEEEDEAGYDVDGGYLPPFNVVYAVCSTMSGMSYEIEDVELGGHWLGVVAHPLAPRLRAHEEGQWGLPLQRGQSALATPLARFLEVPADSEFRPYVECMARYGYVDRATNEAMTIDDPRMKGRFLVLATLRFNRSQADGASRTFWRDRRIRFESVRFRVRADVTAPTDPAVKNNAADLLRLHLGRARVPVSRLDLPSFTAAAAPAEEANGIVRSGDEYAAIEWLLQPMAAALVQSGGKLHLRRRTSSAPAVAITQDMLLEAPEAQHAVPWRQKFNKIRGEIIDSQRSYTRQSTPTYTHHPGRDADGDTYLLDVGAMPMVATQRQAELLLIPELARRRAAETVTVQIHCTDLPAPPEPYDNVSLRLEAEGLAATYRVLGVLQSVEGRVAITCVSERDVATVTAAIDANVPTPRGLYQVLDRTTTAGVGVGWIAPVAPGITGYEVRHRRSGASAWSAWHAWTGGAHRLANPWTFVSGLSADRDYEVQVRALIGATASSASATLAVSTDPAAATAPTGLSAAVSGRVVTLSWTAPTPTPRTIELRGRPSGASRWYNPTIVGWLGRADDEWAMPAWSTATSSSTVELPDGDYEFQVRQHLRSYTPGSPWSASVTATVAADVPAPTVPTVPPAPTFTRANIETPHRNSLEEYFNVAWTAGGSPRTGWTWEIALGGRRGTPMASQWRTIPGSDYTTRRAYFAIDRTLWPVGTGPWIWLRARNSAGAGAAVRQSATFVNP